MQRLLASTVAEADDSLYRGLLRIKMLTISYQRATQVSCRRLLGVTSRFSRCVHARLLRRIIADVAVNYRHFRMTGPDGHIVG